VSDPARRDRFLAALPFGADPFQVAAFDAIDAGSNVLVSAPTGSGKTLVATYGIERQLAGGRRTFYTTPLKALSNQKYNELVARHGESMVGLLTGDASINREAEIVVMTTEVLRNMLLTESTQVIDLGMVVLDEVHYLQDPFRGGVWEEVIILTPGDVQFVALSATISNARVLGEWLDEVRGPTTVIVESVRPIRLHNHVSLLRRGQDVPEVFDLLEDGQLSRESRRVDALMKSTRRFRTGGNWRGPRSSAPPPPFRAPPRGDLLRVMDAEDLLPAIVFIFSRAGCDDAVARVRREGLLFTSPAQRRLVREIATARVSDFSDEELRALEFDPFLDALERGIAAHHAGMVPAFRETVEACFERDLLGVVFATETLALGINMPARSVVLERFSKYSDAGRARLTSGDYAQLTGRAGRRGLDDEGHAVVCFSNDTSMVDVARVALSAPPDLHSSFRPTYNLTANLMHHFDEETALEILQRSFAQFEADRRASARRRSLAELMESRHRALEDLGYATSWSLTERGQRLRRIYHECDLMVCATIESGALEDAEAATVAGVLSSFVFESRGERRVGPHRSTPSKKRRPRNDRLGERRRDDLADRLSLVRSQFARVCEVEGRYQIPPVREPDGSFAATIAAWVRGAPLATVLELAEADTGQFSPGDFVRHAKQVADLLEQVGRLERGRPVGEACEAARRAVVRSVVAAAPSIAVAPEGPA
jgi:ATP-dependent RNA helicase HelY